MAWCKLVFKQNQPIHVGSSKWGVVKETDIFISGQTMWGALTNMYIQKNKISNQGELEQAKKLFETISNFFPSFDGKNILKPSYKNGEFYLGEFSEHKFRAYFVDTYVHTAIEPMSRKAKEGSLYEIDYILPKPKKDFQDKVNMEDKLYWIGIIKIEDTMKEFLDGLKIYVGGDSRYGYGELELMRIENLENEEKGFWWIEGDNIIIKYNDYSPYFIKIYNTVSFEGEYSLLIELNFFKDKMPTITESGWYINIGSKITFLENKENGLSVEINLKKGKLNI